jgi:outer membrane protein OmpA-like peptidoglycan-associated protein/ankyrin repeat protein
MGRKIVFFPLCFIVLAVTLGAVRSANAQNINEQLCNAAADGDLAKVSALLAKGADVNAKDGHGNTPLMLTAAMSGSKQVAEALLAKGADVKAVNEVKQTALYLAARRGFVEIIEMLTAKGADLNAKDTDGKTPLMVAISQEKIESVKTLLAKGADFNAKDNLGDTVLMEAVLAETPDILKLLLAKGVDVNAKNNDGGTALSLATDMGKAEIVKLLKAAGAKVEVPKEPSFAATAAADPDPKTNLLEFANGSVIISGSNSYNGNWSVLNLADGSTKHGWASEKNAAFPHTFVFELPQPHAISSVAVENTGDQTASYPGISSKGVVVYGSTISATKDFTELVSFEAQRGGRKEVDLNTPVTVQWLKFVVSSNWGDPDFTEIMELEACGQPVGPLPKVDVSGIYQTNYGPLRLEQDGTDVAGCYDYRGGSLSGSLHGRVMQVEWRQDEGQRVGTGILVLSAEGDALNGVWYENGELGGEWSGQRGGNPPECKVTKGGTIAAKLAATGKVEIYGIYFDSDSAVPRPESSKTLNEILSVLTSQPALKLTVAGHTDSTNTDEYNLRLSQQRAEAVVLWLVAHSIAAVRLTAKGFGKSQPIADNGTAAGRALNRRVELIAQ